MFESGIKLTTVHLHLRSVCLLPYMDSFPAMLNEVKTLKAEAEVEARITRPRPSIQCRGHMQIFLIKNKWRQCQEHTNKFLIPILEYVTTSLYSDSLTA